jgi:hypothetical protein
VKIIRKGLKKDIELYKAGAWGKDKSIQDVFFFVFFGIIILYCDRIYYMYRTLREVVRGGGGGYKSKRQSLATLRSQRLVLHRPVKVKLCQGVGPPPTVHRSRK